MKAVYKLMALGIALFSLGSNRPRVDTSQVQDSPTPEEIQVYADFLQENGTTINFTSLSNRTFPLDLSDLKNAVCLKGVRLESSSSSKTVHLLGPQVLRGRSIHLVNEQEESAILRQRDAYRATHGADSMNGLDLTRDPGVLVLSEIVFDESHHFAVLKCVILCGSRCNSAVVQVLEKVGPRWTARTRRACSLAGYRENPRE